MKNMPKRDINGECEGEKERQKKIAESKVKSPDSFPNAPGAKSCNESPGFLGGHV